VHNCLTKIKPHLYPIAAVLALIAAASVSGCQSLGAVFSNPAIVQDVVGGVVAILEETGTTEAQIHQAVVKAQTTATGATVTLAAMESVLTQLPTVGPAVAQWLGENPELAQTTTDLNTWLSAFAQATTAGTAAQSNVQLRLHHAAGHIERTLPVTIVRGWSQPVLLPMVTLPEIVVPPPQAVSGVDPAPRS
jgi:hypothetical protein